MDGDIKQIIKRSVTKDDFNTGVLHFMLPGNFSQRRETLPSDLPAYWSPDRDIILHSTITADALWASAVSIACTKMASMAWAVDGPIPIRVKRAQELLHMADLQRGWVQFTMKHLQDYLLTDNGAFVEIVRATSSMNSQIIGITHLDSTRCTRTGDPEIPVVYRDRFGRLHEMRRHEVIDISDMPDSRETYFGVGHCAASRAYKQILKMVGIETYIYEKITGRKIKDVHFVSGINERQVRNFVDAAENQADASGLVAYMGAVIVPVPGELPPQTARIPLAEFPDGFDRKQEFDISILAYADAIGLDPQDLQPLTGQSLGSGAQSQVLEDKAAGKGLAAWRSAFTHAMNLWVIPDLTTMMFVENDWRDKKLSADFKATTGKYVVEAVAGGVITTAQGLQALVDSEVFPKEFLVVDETPDETLTDTEKPGVAEETADIQAETEPAPEVVEEPVLEVEPEVEEDKEEPTAKAAKQPTTEEIMEETLPEATSLAKRILAKLRKRNKAVDAAEDALESSEQGILIHIPQNLLAQKQAPPEITVNVPAPIVNVAAPVVNVPAPVVNVQPAPAPVVNVQPPDVHVQVAAPEVRIERPAAEPKKAEFVVHRDNYGNVLGIEEK